MTTLRFVQTRPSTDVPFYTYPEAYTVEIKAKYTYTRSRVVSSNGLQATTELQFANADAANAFIADPLRVSQLAVAKSHNQSNGITTVVTRI